MVDGGPGQHTGGDPEIAEGNHRREADGKAGGATGIHDPIGGVERDEDKLDEGDSRVIGRHQVKRELPEAPKIAKDRRK